MSDANEPLDAISAEMRKAVVPMICGRPKIEAVSIRDVLQWADRIDAAAKRMENCFGMALSIEEGLRKRDRERAGSAAALRAALERIVRYEVGINQCIEDGHAPGVDWDGITFSMIQAAKSALAAPARNCDRFRTADEAAKVYRAETEPDRQNPECYWPCIFSWLFDTVEKGGAK